MSAGLRAIARVSALNPVCGMRFGDAVLAILRKMKRAEIANKTGEL